MSTVRDLGRRDERKIDRTAEGAVLGDAVHQDRHLLGGRGA